MINLYNLSGRVGPSHTRSHIRANAPRPLGAPKGTELRSPCNRLLAVTSLGPTSHVHLTRGGPYGPYGGDPFPWERRNLVHHVTWCHDDETFITRFFGVCAAAPPHHQHVCVLSYCSFPPSVHSLLATQYSLDCNGNTLHWRSPSKHVPESAASRR